MDVGTNRNRTAIHWVPNGKRTILVGLKFSASTSGGVIYILERTIVGTNLVPIALGVEQIEIANSVAIMPLPLPHVLENPNNNELTFAVVAKGRAANQTGSCTFQFIDMPL